MPMKIAFIGDFEISENYPNTKHFIEAVKCDERFEVIKCTARKTSDRKLYDSSRGLFSAVKTLLKMTLAGIRSASELNRLGRSSCDVVYVPYPAVLVLFFHSLFYRKYSNGPVITMDCFISLYDTVVVDRKILSSRNILSRWLRFVERRAVRHSDLVVADTQPNADYLYALFGGDKNKYQAINLCINESLFNSAAVDSITANPARSTLPAKLEVLFVGSFVPLQGATIVAEAAIALAHRQDIHFHMVGDGQTAGEVQALLQGRDLNLSWDRAWLAIDEIARMVSAADICLGVFGAGAKASRVLPYKVYMALASAKPVISMEVQDTVIQESVIPFLSILQNSGAALADQITQLADSPKLREELGSRARGYYERHLSNSKAVDDFHRLLCQELAVNPP